RSRIRGREHEHYTFRPTIGNPPSAALFERRLQPAVKTDPQIVLFRVTHRVTLSAWHELAESPWFSGVWRKSHAEERELIWEMRVYNNDGRYFMLRDAARCQSIQFARRSGGNEEIAN
ncbi:MAG: hypothetical protein SGJ19_00700, partial [Planctomycetia bacterium]|nr:hypothetical protein [Planctomycetia bacterium]